MLNVELWGLRRKCPCCFAERDNSTFNIQHLTLFSLPLDVSDNIALAHLAALLGIDFYELAAQCSWDGFKLAPRSLDIAEGITFFIFLADVWLYSWLALALALEFQKSWPATGATMASALACLNSASCAGVRVVPSLASFAF